MDVLKKHRHFLDYAVSAAMSIDGTASLGQAQRDALHPNAPLRAIAVRTRAVGQAALVASSETGARVPARSAKPAGRPLLFCAIFEIAQRLRLGALLHHIWEQD